MIEPILYKTLGARVKYARRNLANLTQNELAEKIGVRQPTISSIEKDEQGSTKHILELAKVLKVSVGWLYEGIGPIDNQDAMLSDLRENAGSEKKCGALKFSKLEALVDKFELTEEQIRAIEASAIEMAQNFFLDK